MADPYSAEFKAATLKLADEIGPQKAARQQGISYNTVRRWREPEFRAKERASDKSRKTVPCGMCGKPATRYERKRPEHIGLCRSCINTLTADEARGATVQEIIDLYLVDRLSTNQIAAKAHRSQTAVHALLVNNDVEMRTMAESIALSKGGEHSHGRVDPAQITVLRNTGISVSTIASRLGCSGNTVVYWLKKNGDPLHVAKLSMGFRTWADARGWSA